MTKTSAKKTNPTASAVSKWLAKSGLSRMDAHERTPGYLVTTLGRGASAVAHYPGPNGQTSTELDNALTHYARVLRKRGWLVERYDTYLEVHRGIDLSEQEPEVPNIVSENWENDLAEIQAGWQDLDEEVRIQAGREARKACEEHAGVLHLRAEVARLLPRSDRLGDDAGYYIASGWIQDLVQLAYDQVLRGGGMRDWYREGHESGLSEAIHWYLPSAAIGTVRSWVEVYVRNVLRQTLHNHRSE